MLRLNKKVSLRVWLLGIYLALAPFDFIPVFFGFSVSRFLIFIPIIGCLISLRQLKIRVSFLMIAPILFIILNVLSTIYSYNIDNSLNRTITLSLNLLSILFIGSFKYNTKELKFIKKAMVYSGWITLLLIVFYSKSNIYSGRLTIIIDGSHQDPNYLIGFLLFTIIYYFNNYLINHSSTSLIYVAIFFSSLLLTGSRGGLIAIVISGLFLILTLSKKIKYRYLLIIFAFIFLYTSRINIIPEYISTRYNISTIISDEASGRFKIWNSILTSYKDAPIFNQLFGWGAGTIRYFTYNGNVAHNIFLETLIELGVFGLLSHFILYLVYFIKSLRMKDKVIVTSLLGYIIMGMSLSLYSYKPIWNIFLLILIVFNNEANSENE